MPGGGPAMKRGTLTEADVAQRCADAGVELLEDFTEPSRKYWVRYLECGHEYDKWFNTIGRIPCEICGSSSGHALTLRAVQQRCADAGVELLDEYAGTSKKYRVRYVACGHEQEQWFFRLGKTLCRMCNPSQQSGASFLSVGSVRQRCADAGVELLDEYAGADKRYRVRYIACGHEQEQLFSTLGKTTCRTCAPPGLSAEQVRQRCAYAGVELLDEYAGADKRYRVRYIACGHEQEQLFSTLGKTTCRTCAPPLRFGKPSLSAEQVRQRCADAGVELLDEYVGSSERYRVRYVACGHEQEQWFGNLGKLTCRVCTPPQQFGTPSLSAEQVQQRCADAGVELLDEYTGTSKKYRVRYVACGHEKEYWFSSLGPHTVCRICTPLQPFGTSVLSAEQVQQRCADAGVELLDEYAGASKKYRMRYVACGHEKEQRFSSLGPKTICRVCTPQQLGKSALSAEQVQQRCADAGVELLDEYTGAGKKYRVRYVACGHEQEQWFSSLGPKTICRVCTPQQLGKPALSAEQVQQRCADAGVELLDEYAGTGKKYRVRYVACGHEKEYWFSNLGPHTVCRICTPWQPFETSTLSAEQVQQRCADAGVELLDEYTGAGKKYRVRYVACGHEQEQRFSVLGTPRCQTCAPSGLSAEQVQQRCADAGVELLDEYTVADKKYRVRHVACGHEKEYWFSTLGPRTVCRVCTPPPPSQFGKPALSAEQVQQRCADAGIELLDEYTGASKKYRVRHVACGHEKEQWFSDISSQTTCRICTPLQPFGKPALSAEQVQQRCADAGVELLDEYTGASKKYRVRHVACGHEKEQWFSDISSQTTCRICTPLQPFGKPALSAEQVQQRCADAGVELLDEYTGAGKKYRVRYVACGHEQEQRFSDISSQTTCRICTPLQPFGKPALSAEQVQQRCADAGVELLDEYTGASKKYRMRHVACGHEKEQWFSSLGPHTVCRTCTPLQHFGKPALSAEQVQQRCADAGIELLDEYTGASKKYRIRYIACGHEQEQWFSRLGPKSVCRTCTPPQHFGKPPLSAEQVQQRCADAGVELLETYAGRTKKYRMRHVACGHEQAYWFHNLGPHTVCRTCTPLQHFGKPALSAEQVQQRCADAGVELLDEYTGTSKKYRIRYVACGHEKEYWFNSLGPHTVCRICTPPQQLGKPVLSAEQVQQRCADAGVELLDEYTGASKKYRIRYVACGHEKEYWFNSLGPHTVCRTCTPPQHFGKSLLSAEQVQQRCADAGVELLDEYTGADKKYRMRHVACGHEQEQWFSSLGPKSVCRVCTPLQPFGKPVLSAEQVQQRCADAGVELLETYAGRAKKYRMRHVACGHEKEYWFHNLGPHTVCRTCTPLQHFGKPFLTAEQVQQRCADAGVELLDEYTGTSKKYRMRHVACGHEQEQWFSSLGPKSVCRTCTPRQRPGKPVLSAEQVQQRCADAGVELLDEYTGASKKYRMRHVACGHEQEYWFHNLGPHTVCRTCTPLQHFGKPFLTAEQVEKRCADAGLKLLDEYKGTKYTYRVQYVACGHETRKYFNDFAGAVCRICTPYKPEQVRLTAEEAQQRCEDVGVQLLDNFTGVSKMYRFRCVACGRERFQIFKSLREDQCKGCKRTSRPKRKKR
jgi:methionyl-tRNA formyltransferase